jgi:hypothetical protein
MSVFKSKYVTGLLLWSSLLSWPILSFSAESLALFHGGKRAYLEEDVRQKGISPEVWDKFIFGKTNFDLPDYRKGLYGADDMGGTSLYTTYNLLAGQEPWVMLIKIKPSCAVNPGFYYTDYTISQAKAKDASMFSKWFLNKLNYADATSKQKIELDMQECSKELIINNDPPVAYRIWNESIFYSMNKHSVEEQTQTLRCTAYLNEFLLETKIKLVQDNVNGEDGSWYIRDRNCIENISGTPDELFRAISQNQIGNKQTALDQNLFGDLVEPGHFPAGSLYIFLRVLAETSLLKAENTKLLNKIERAMDFDHKNPKARDQEIIHLFEKQEFAFNTFRHVNLFVSMAVRAAKQAIKSNQVTAFQKQLAELLTQLRVQHGEACRGGEGGFQGVQAENKERCEQVSLLQGQKLMGYFIKSLGIFM